MKIKEMLKRIKLNQQEGSMLDRFLKWRLRKEQKCRICGEEGISNDFDTSGLCFHCWYKTQKGGLKNDNSKRKRIKTI